MTRNDYPTLTEDMLDAIAELMDEEIRESLHSAQDWQQPGEFLTAYIERDPEFPIHQFSTGEKA